MNNDNFWYYWDYWLTISGMLNYKTKIAAVFKSFLTAAVLE